MWAVNALLRLSTSGISRASLRACTVPSYRIVARPIALCFRAPISSCGTRGFAANGSQAGDTLQKTRGGVALIVGAGDGAGQAIARRFSKEMTVCVVRRPKPESVAQLNLLVDEIKNQGGKAHAFGVDARNETDVADLVQKIEDDIGPVEVLVFNIGANVRFSILDTTVRVYTKVWEMACLAGFISGRECAKRMLSRERGTIIFSGATASLRGSSGFCAFAGAKHALRALAQSMARELGPKGIHVCHVVIDGAVDTPWIRENFAKHFDEMKDKGGVVEPDAIAEQYWQLVAQRKEAWTHEMELRPWLEKW